MFTLIVGCFARGPAPSGRDVPIATAMRIAVGAADSGRCPSEEETDAGPRRDAHASRARNFACGMTQERLDEADGNPRLSDRTAGVLGLLAALRNSSRAAKP